jgi:ribonucleoside-diphosphate reductase alpha chain
LDFIDLSSNRIIEFDGDYWHCEARGNVSRDRIRDEILTKNGVKYGSEEGLKLVDKYMQHMSYYLINKSCELNKKYRVYNDNSLYQIGCLPFESRNKNVDKLVKHELYDGLDWDGLKRRLLRNGIANTALMAVAPTESSSQVLNATNGVEMPREAVSRKGSKDGTLPQVVPELPDNMEFQYLFNQVGCREYLKTIAVIQKYVDQSISTNTFYNPNHYKDNKLSETNMLSDIIYAHKIGLKTLYYAILNDKQEEELCEGCVV